MFKVIPGQGDIVQHFQAMKKIILKTKRKMLAANIRSLKSHSNVVHNLNWNISVKSIKYKKICSIKIVSIDTTVEVKHSMVEKEFQQCCKVESG